MAEKKLFGTDGIRGKANRNPITPEIMLKLGKSLAYFVTKSRKQAKILIGKDTRASGYILENALTSGICSTGADVLLVGPLPTPAIAHLTQSFNAAAAIMISASHNPAEDNGIKIFSEKGLKLTDKEELELEKNIFKDDYPESKSVGKAQRINAAAARYVEYAKQTINNQSLAGLTIAVDCANGAAYAVAPKIFHELDAEVIPLHNKPDGKNINKDCGATHPETIQNAARKHKADIGIAFDGDADRVILVDEEGTILNGDHILTILALHMHKQGKLKKETIVATNYSNLGLDTVMEENGIVVSRVQNGDRYVIKEMRDKGYNLGGERSGHIILGDYSTTGDGILTALQILKIMKRQKTTLSELKNILHEFPQILLNVRVAEKKPFDGMPTVKKNIADIETQLKGTGRLLVRYSGTENIARIMIEGKNQKVIKNLARDLANRIQEEIGA